MFQSTKKRRYKHPCSLPALSRKMTFDSPTRITPFLHRRRHQTRRNRNSWFCGPSARVSRKISCCKDAHYYQNTTMHPSWSEATVGPGRWSIRAMRSLAYAGLPERARQSHKFYLDLFYVWLVNSRSPCND